MFAHELLKEVSLSVLVLLIFIFKISLNFSTVVKSPYSQQKSKIWPLALLNSVSFKNKIDKILRPAVIAGYEISAFYLQLAFSHYIFKAKNVILLFFLIIVNIEQRKHTWKEEPCLF